LLTASDPRPYKDANPTPQRVERRLNNFSFAGGLPTRLLGRDGSIREHTTGDVLPRRDDTRNPWRQRLARKSAAVAALRRRQDEDERPVLDQAQVQWGRLAAARPATTQRIGIENERQTDGPAGACDTRRPLAFLPQKGAGKGGTSLPLPPLRTVRETCTSYGSSKPRTATVARSRLSVGCNGQSQAGGI
jgi:hypothetical protein